MLNFTVHNYLFFISYLCLGNESNSKDVGGLDEN